MEKKYLAIWQLGQHSNGIWEGNVKTVKIDVIVDGRRKEVEIASGKAGIVTALSKNGQLTEGILETLTTVSGRSSFVEVETLPENFVGVALFHADGRIEIRDGNSLKGIKRHLVIPNEKLPVV